MKGKGRVDLYFELPLLTVYVGCPILGNIMPFFSLSEFFSLFKGNNRHLRKRRSLARNTIKFGEKVCSVNHFIEVEPWTLNSANDKKQKILIRQICIDRSVSKQMPQRIEIFRKQRSTNSL